MVRGIRDRTIANEPVVRRRMEATRVQGPREEHAQQQVKSTEPKEHSQQQADKSVQADKSIANSRQDKSTGNSRQDKSIANSSQKRAPKIWRKIGQIQSLTP